MSGQAIKRTLRAGRAIFRIEVASGLQYRLSALAGSTTSIFWAFIECVVLTVFYTRAQNYTAGLQAGLSLPQVITYVWLGQATWMLQPVCNDGSIAAMITKGDVGVELCRPLDLYAHWYARLGAMRVAPLLLRGVPILIAGLLMPGSFALSAPVSTAGLLATLAALCCALALSASVAVLAHALLLNVHWGQGPVNMLLLITGVLSGTYLPLQLWPDALQPFLRVQPFAGFLDLPARLYLGVTPVSGLPAALGLQLGWTALFIVAGRLLMRRNLKRLVVQGG